MVKALTVTPALPDARNPVRLNIWQRQPDRHFIRAGRELIARIAGFYDMPVEGITGFNYHRDMLHNQNLQFISRAALYLCYKGLNLPWHVCVELFDKVNSSSAVVQYCNTFAACVHNQSTDGLEFSRLWSAVMPGIMAPHEIQLPATWLSRDQFIALVQNHFGPKDRITSASIEGLFHTFKAHYPHKLEFNIGQQHP